MTDKIELTREQYNKLDRFVIAYMSVVKNDDNLTMEQQSQVLKALDRAWDGQFCIKDQIMTLTIDEEELNQAILEYITKRFPNHEIYNILYYTPNSGAAQNKIRSEIEILEKE